MRILIVNTSDIQGGAARAAYRLHKALLVREVDSHMVVQSKSSDDYTVHGPSTNYYKVMAKVRPILDSIPVRRYHKRTKTSFSPSCVPYAGLVDKINSLKPDVVHLHWIAGGMFPIEDLVKINIPIVWSLHDMWAFTGGCHYNQDCGGYQNQCGRCPVLGSNKEKDLSRKVWLRKQACISLLPNMTIIGLSKWMADCAVSSSLFKNNPVVNLPNPINTKIFAPVGRAEARRLFNLPDNKKLILFGAMGATVDRRKGFKELCKSLSHLPVDYDLVVFGSSEPQVPQDFKQKAHYLGHLYDDISLRVLYSAADVMVVPSLQEAFGQTATESMACGTPVVAFGTTGLLDIVEHKLNGYLAKVFDVKDLAKGIQWVLQHEHPEQLGQAARDKVVCGFDSHVVANQYINLYGQVMHKRSID